MNRKTMAAAAFAVGAAIAAPLALPAAADDMQMAQAGPGPQGMGGMPEMMHRMMGGDEIGPMGRHHGWMHRMMQMQPRQRCEERIARRAGIVAYVVARLNLTAEQKPLWDKLQAIMQANADKERQLCAGLKPADQRGQETLLDKLNRREQFLSARLQAMHDARPALEQLYQALTPEQKAIVDHPFRR